MKNILTLFLFITFFIGGHTLSAQQEKCGFDHMMQSKISDPVFQKNRAAYEHYVKKMAKSPQRRTAGTITIPCVVHIIHTGQAIGTATGTGANPNDAQVNSAIADMNDAFRHEGVYDMPAKNMFYDASTDVRFILAKRAPDGSATSGIIRYNVSGEDWGTKYMDEGMDAGLEPGVPQETITAGRYWPPSDYMNIWIVHEVENSTETLGFASFPQANSGSTDCLTVLASAFGYDPGNASGFILNSATNLNGTANHETGHYLSLYHSFQGDMVEVNGSLVSRCPPNVTCGTDSDCCADIPPHKRSSGCPTDANVNDCASDGPNAYIHNFMDYSDDACFHGFSENQKTRMEAALSGPRSALCTSIAATAPTGTFPVAPSSSMVTNHDTLMGIYDVTLNGTSFKSLSTYHDGGYLNRVASQPAIDLMHGTNYTLNIQVGVGNTVKNELAAAYIDYNNNGVFTDPGEQIGVSAAGSGLKNGAIHSFSFTTPPPTPPSFGSSNDGRLRMRIITDLDNGVTPLTSTISASQGGQIEDYAVSFSSSLPVELIAFNANLKNNKLVEISWTTEKEISNSHFDIERSNDGLVFNKINSVVGNGNSNSSRNYKGIDRYPLLGLNYYRLKQVDFDGSYAYSDIKAVEVRKENISVVIHPNPAKDKLYIGGINQDYYQVEVFDQLGKMVVTADSSSIIDVHALPNGVYFIKVTADGLQHVEKILIRH